MLVAGLRGFLIAGGAGLFKSKGFPCTKCVHDLCYGGAETWDSIADIAAQASWCGSASALLPLLPCAPGSTDVTCPS